MPKHDLFISHSSSDATVARELRGLLEAAGYTCWLAPDDVTGTDPWAEQILAAIEGSRAMLVLISAASNKSTHVSREVGLAQSRGRVVLPVRVEPIAPAGALEYHVAGLQRLDVFPLPVRLHRDEILRRLAITVPLAAVGDAGAEGQAGERPVPAREGPADDRGSARRPPAERRRLGAWARANSMLAGSIVTFGALFLVVAIGLAVNPGPTTPSVAPSGVAADGASASIPASIPPDASLPGFQPSATDEPFPNTAELALFEALPEAGRSDIVACERDENLFDGAVVGLTCHADDGELLFYEGFADPTTQRRQYLDLVRGQMGNPDGSCSFAPEGDEAWSRPDGRFGHVACGVNDLGLYSFLWTDESKLISVSWYAGYDVDLAAERAKGYEVFLNWTGG